MNKNTDKQSILGAIPSNSGIYYIENVPPPAPTVLQTSIQTNGSTLTLPSGISAGQFIIIFVASFGTVAATPSGYNRTIATTAGSPYLGVFTKTANGTEGGTTITVSGTSSPSVCAVLDRGNINVIGTDLRVSSDSGVVPGINPGNYSLNFLMTATDANIDSNPTINTDFIPFADVSGGYNDEMYLFYRYTNSSIPSTTVTWTNNLSGIMFSVK
jgi:hypothetical protein